MSVLGVGIDLVEVAPFARQLALAGSCFAESTFTAAELASAEEAAAGASGAEGAPAAARARHLAARFAAKEAFVKAWASARPGLPPALAEIDWRTVEVATDPWGRPSLHTHSDTAGRLLDTLGRTSASVSLTHEDSVAGAVVVLSALAPPSPGPAPGTESISTESARTESISTESARTESISTESASTESASTTGASR